MVESSALLKRRSPKGYRGFESLPHRFFSKTNERKRLDIGGAMLRTPSELRILSFGVASIVPLSSVGDHRARPLAVPTIVLFSRRIREREQSPETDRL